MTKSIATVTARAKLKPRREPYWSRISKGFYLGYRKMTANSEGSWILRITSELNTKDSYRTLGAFSELPDHQRRQPW